MLLASCRKGSGAINQSIAYLFHQRYLIFQGIKALSSHTVKHIGTDGNMLVYYLGSTCQTRTVRKKRQIKDIARGRGSGSVYSVQCTVEGVDTVEPRSCQLAKFVDDRR